MVKILFSFHNSEHKVQDEVRGTMNVLELKTLLLKEKWPPELSPSESVRGLRYFCMGKELADSVRVSEIQGLNSDLPVPILVHIAQRAEDKGFPRTTSHCCSCAIL